ncbi:MAG: hypothetical protein HYX20_02760 [Candidatus Yanofskybacteria bacterium]|nr:hypothetical protein [Candidatus Yanofskybacteria bacterium]
MLFRIRKERINKYDEATLKAWESYGKTKGWGEPIRKEFYIQRFMGWYPIGFWTKVSSGIISYNTGDGDYASQEHELYFETPEMAVAYINKKFPGATIHKYPNRISSLVQDQSNDALN